MSPNWRNDVLVKRLGPLCAVALVAALIAGCSAARLDAAPCPAACQRAAWTQAVHRFQAEQWAAAQRVTLERQWFAARILATRQANCVIDKESRNAHEFTADNGVGYTGAFQFGIATSNFGTTLMHRPDLYGIPTKFWPWWDQAEAFARVWDRDRGSDWAPDGCGTAPL